MPSSLPESIELLYKGNIRSNNILQKNTGHEGDFNS